MTEPTPQCHPEPAFRVRPYTVTGGRTRPAVEIPKDAPVRMIATLVPDGLGPAHRRILELLEQPTAAAEMATRAELPLPVAQVLIGDLVESGLVAVDVTPDDNDRPDLQLLQTVLEGLHSP